MTDDQLNVELLNTTDIFDLYGCEYIFNLGAAEQPDKAYVASRIDEIHAKYLHAARERIKAECEFLGIDVKDFSFSKMLDEISSALENELKNQSEQMMRGGEFNMMKAILNAQAAAGANLEGIDTERFGINKTVEKKKSNSIDTASLVKDPKWHIIAKAFVDLENANSTTEKILSIDRLNDLQHNSFHLLIDLQTGRMLTKYEGQKDHSEAVEIVNEVLDIKKNATSPKEYAEKMSRDIAKLVVSYLRMFR